MVSRKRRAAEASVEAGAVAAKPNGRPPTAYPNWDGERGCWVDDAGKERPSALPATVQPEQQPEPQPMMEQPPSQPRTPHVHTYSLGRGMPTIVGPGTVPLPQLGRYFAACEQQRGMNASDAWAHAIIVTNSVFCTILPRVDDPDPDTHL